MDSSDHIEKFTDFISKYHHAEIIEKIRKGDNHFVIDFMELAAFNSELTEDLIDNPEDVIKAFELSVAQNMDLPSSIEKFKIRLKNLPKSQEIAIRNIRSKHIGRLLYFQGIVRQKSDVRPQITSARFECPSCGNVINVLQLEQKFKEPTKCGCGRKGKFRLLSKKLIDAQGIVLEESPDDLDGGEQPKRINIFLKEDLVSPITEKRTNPGSKIGITGMVKEIPIIMKNGSQSVRFDLLIEGNYVEPLQEDYLDIKINEEEEKEIKDLANDKNVYKKIIDCLAPTIYGYDEIKESLLLQLVGGCKKKRTDGTITRGDMHILLIGDPGSGKSQLIKRMLKIAPKAKFVSGKGASAAGLTASVVKDEFLNGWALEAGTLVLANHGFAMIDELDKISKEDRDALHEALEGQQITIAKANIQATLKCETTVLAAANPKFGRFDPFNPIAKQIDLPPTLINRFDLIFPVKDIPDLIKDDLLAKHILSLHQNPDIAEPELNTEFLKKYISYVRTRCVPVLTDGAINEIKSYYVDMRNSGTNEGGIKSVPISARQLEALVRLSEASAKVRLSDKVTKRDSKRAIRLLHNCLTEIGVDPETGKIDIDRISTGITTSQRSKIIIIKEIINELENKIGKTIPIEDIIAEAATRGISQSKIEESIEKLKRNGDIFEPREGFITKL